MDQGLLELVRKEISRQGLNATPRLNICDTPNFICAGLELADSNKFGYGIVLEPITIKGVIGYLSERRPESRFIEMDISGVTSRGYIGIWEEFMHLDLKENDILVYHNSGEVLAPFFLNPNNSNAGQQQQQVRDMVQMIDRIQRNHRHFPNECLLRDGKIAYVFLVRPEEDFLYRKVCGTLGVGDGWRFDPDGVCNINTLVDTPR
ncbi:MAG: hypothetical protein WCV90_08660 [Candidatus Woesearchaeota archaeon]